MSGKSEVRSPKSELDRIIVDVKFGVVGWVATSSDTDAFSGQWNGPRNAVEDLAEKVFGARNYEVQCQKRNRRYWVTRKEAA
jgi:hypothetical protein